MLEATVAKLTARPSLPANLDAGVIDSLPDGPGVYLFYGENDLPVYVGKSTGIRKRVLSHFAADHATAKEMALAQQVRRIECISTGGEIGALLKEAALIKTLQPIHNRSLRRNDELCFWQLVEARQGEWHPQLVPVAALPADFAGDDAPRGHRDQAHDRERGHALAAPTLADNAERLALVDVQVDTVDHRGRAAAGRDLDRKSANVE